jgi:carbonic anhydrase/acetyltransferase-like protein (isoleucine patch superfamily)
MPNLLPGLLISIMWMGSLALASLPVLLAQDSSLGLRILSLLFGLPIFALSFMVIAGILSWPAQRKIVRGRFPRENFHKVYFWRRIFGCCWTTVFYFKPLYSVLLAVPVLKKTLFRLFGYRGPLNFVVYPDTWIRDLPLLYFGEGAYCSNRSTIGSNLCLQDGTILVDKITIGDRAVVGHLTMIAAGVKLEKDTELGVGVALGIRCRMKEGAKIGAGSSVNHGSVFGARSEIGGHSHVGLRVEIADDIKIPAGANLPAGAVIRTQDDVNKYISSENQVLREHVQNVAETLQRDPETLRFND